MLLLNVFKTRLGSASNVKFFFSLRPRKINVLFEVLTCVRFSQNLAILKQDKKLFFFCNISLSWKILDSNRTFILQGLSGKPTTEFAKTPYFRKNMCFLDWILVRCDKKVLKELVIYYQHLHVGVFSQIILIFRSHRIFFLHIHVKKVLSKWFLSFSSYG